MPSCYPPLWPCVNFSLLKLMIYVCWDNNNHKRMFISIINKDYSKFRQWEWHEYNITYNAHQMDKLCYERTDIFGHHFLPIFLANPSWFKPYRNQPTGSRESRRRSHFLTWLKNLMGGGSVGSLLFQYRFFSYILYIFASNIKLHSLPSFPSRHFTAHKRGNDEYGLCICSHILQVSAASQHYSLIMGTFLNNTVEMQWYSR